MSQVYQRVMADGDWELNLHPDTPRAILDKLAPFQVHVVITPGEIDVTSSDSVFLAAARYVGVVRRLGRNRLNPGGPGTAMWLSDPDGKGEIITTKISLSSAPLSTSINAVKPNSITIGTITSPGGTFSIAYQYVTRRDAINNICRAFGVEWRINNDFTIDVATVANLYNTTPLAVVARNTGGRDSSIVGIRADLDTNIDWEEYVSNVVVIGNGVGTNGGATPFLKPNGLSLTWTRVVEDPQTPAGGLTAVAQAVFDLLQTDSDGRRELRVSTDLYDVAGDVGLGDNVYVWDQENGIVDTGNQVHYQGQLIYPATLRCIGMRWPVRRGMGVYLRTSSASTPTYENITPYVEFSEGAAELELGAASRLLRSDTAGQISEVTGQVKQAPWLTYTPTISGTGTAVGNGSVVGAYRREGTTLHLDIRWTLGSMSTVGSGGITFSLPSGMTGVTQTNRFQKLEGQAFDGANSTDAFGYVASGSSSVVMQVRNAAGTYATWAGISATAPFTWGSGDAVGVNGTLEVAP